MADHIVRRRSADDPGATRDRTTTELSPEALQDLLRENARLTLDELDAAVEAAARASDEPRARGSLADAPRWAHTLRRDAREDEISTIAMPRIDRHVARSSTAVGATTEPSAEEVSDPEILIEVAAEVGVIDGAHDSVAILHSPRTRPPSAPAYAPTQPIHVSAEHAPILLEPAMVVSRPRPQRNMTTMKVESLRRLPVVSMQVLTPPPNQPLPRPAGSLQPWRASPEPQLTRAPSLRAPRILAPLTRKLPRFSRHRFTAPRVALVFAIVLAACYWCVR